jgi:hypothetical protein
MSQAERTAQFEDRQHEEDRWIEAREAEEIYQSSAQEAREEWKGRR